MCTVTLALIPNSDRGFVLTSNRDEAVVRETLAPDLYFENGLKMLYPKDRIAGGTWIGMSERERVICLLNGGFVKHVPNPPYRKSRGVVVKELLAFINVKEEIEQYDFKGIEAFTAVIVDWGSDLEFWELVWDGSEMHLRQLSLDSYIWSSALLYSSEEIERRKSMFEEFKKSAEATPGNLLDFHSTEGDDSKEGLIINRGVLKTCSITQISRVDGEVNMWYRDLSKDLETEHRF